MYTSIQIEPKFGNENQPGTFSSSPAVGPSLRLVINDEQKQEERRASNDQVMRTTQKRILITK